MKRYASARSALLGVTAWLCACQPAPSVPTAARGSASAAPSAPATPAIASAAASSVASAKPVHREILVGRPRSLDGVRWKGPRAVVTIPERDSVVFFFQDAPARSDASGDAAWAGDARIGWMLILDGAQARVSFREAWSVTPAGDGRHVVYAAGERIAGEADIERAAASLGIEPKKIAASVFRDRDGTEWLLRAVRFDLESGRDQPRSAIGSLALGRAAPAELAPADGCFEKGHVLARTRNNNLAIAVTEPCFTVQAIRYER